MLVTFVDVVLAKVVDLFDVGRPVELIGTRLLCVRDGVLV